MKKDDSYELSSHRTWWRNFGIDQIIIHNNYESYSTIASNLLKDYKGDILAEDNPDNHIVSLYSGDFKYYNTDLINFIENQKQIKVL